MKRYLDYMDHITAPDALHEKLTGLQPPDKRKPAWRKYAVAAAALALAVGVGGLWLEPSAGEHVPHPGGDGGRGT